jgi:hypothetical protein
MLTKIINDMNLIRIDSLFTQRWQFTHRSNCKRAEQGQS